MHIRGAIERQLGDRAESGTAHTRTNGESPRALGGGGGQPPLGQPAPDSDPHRLAALRRTGLLDTPPEEAFDRLTRIASTVLRAPVSLVSLVDADRQFFKSQVGLPEPWGERRETPLSHSFCQHAVASREPLVIEDARTHPLVRDNLAIPDLGVIAYAGIPLITRDGHALGSFCVIDTQPRRWTDSEVAMLRDLAASVVAEIELRLAAVAAEQERARTFALLHEAPAAICVLRGPHHVIEFANSRYLELVDGRDVLHKTAREAFPEVESQGLFELLDGVYATGEAYAGSEVPVRLASWPAERYFSFVYQPTRGADGAVDGVFVHAVEVTDQVFARRRAESLASEREAILAQTAEGIVVADPDGRIAFVNEAARRLHGLAELGVPVAGFSAAYGLFTLDGEPYPPHELPLARAATRGETVVDARWRVRRPDGSEIVAQGSAAPVRAADGTRLGAVLVMRDVTSQTELERERAARATAEARLEGVRLAAREMADLLGNALVTPSAAVDLLQVHAADGGLGDLLRRAAADLRRAAEHLTRFQQVERIETKPTPAGPALDLLRSSA